MHDHMTCWAIICFMVFMPVSLQAEERRSLGHAHNDYLHERPLLDALDRGFRSVEADVFLKDGKLQIGHTQFGLSPERTLKSVYLDPLLEQARHHKGGIYDDKAPFYLLIDIKSDGPKTFEAIHARLAKYPELISSRKDGRWTQHAVTVVISGNVPHKMILEQTPCYAGIDGRPSDLGSDVAAEDMPWISAKWDTLSKWKGKGEMPAADKKKLREYVAKAHQKGRLVRFWDTPEKPEFWRELRNQQVDLIGTDDLPALEAFLKTR